MITFKDGTLAGPVAIEYPLGHKRRREEAIGPLIKKLENSLENIFAEKTQYFADLMLDQVAFESLSVVEFMESLSISGR